MDALARATLQRHFGYPDFRPGQVELVTAALGGRDALGVLPTGGGKSVCYQVPALLLPGMTIVVSPLISLMADQVARCIEAGIPAAALNSALSQEEMRDTIERARAGAVRVLLVAPERFGTASFRSLLPQLDVSLVAIDEAHCISEWGHDFRPSYLKLGDIRSLVSAPVLALTATATPRVRDEIVSVLQLRDPVRIVKSFDRPNLAWHILKARDATDKFALLRRMIRRHSASEGSVMIYAATRKAVESTRGALASLGLPAEGYHAGLPPEERARVQDRFMNGGKALVVATNAFGMGIDKATVRLVVHLELPRTLESYYQEAGRAGRDGEPADCVAFHTKADRLIQVGFIDRSHPQPRTLNQVAKFLRSVVGPGKSTRLLVDDICAAGRPRLTAEEAGSVLRVLAGAGAIRLLDASPEDPAVDPSTRWVRLGVHRRRPDLGQARARREGELEKLAGVERFARTRRCRRGYLLAYFGEESAEGSCNGCDRCGSDRPLF